MMLDKSQLLNLANYLLNQISWDWLPHTLKEQIKFNWQKIAFIAVDANSLDVTCVNTVQATGQVIQRLRLGTILGINHRGHP